MAVEACSFEVQRIEAEGTLPVVEAPPSLLGERPVLGGSHAGEIHLADDASGRVVLGVDSGVAAGEQHRR
jgi:hypothetical protein